MNIVISYCNNLYINAWCWSWKPLFTLGEKLLKNLKLVWYCSETLQIYNMKRSYYSTPNLPCHLAASISTLFFSLFLLLERWYGAWSRNSNDTVKELPLNYLAMVSFYRHKVYLWSLLKAWYLEAVSRVYLYSGSCCCMIFLSVIQNGNAVMYREGTSWCLPSWKWRQHCLFVYFVLYTNKNTLEMKPWCNDDLKRNDTLSHNIVLSNSPELP